MNKAFDETTVGAALTAAIDLIYAGLLWCLCAIPVFTLGSASTALYYATVKSVRHERGHVTSAFFSSFKANFGISLKIWLLMLAYLLIGVLDIYATGRMGLGKGTLMWYLLRILLAVPLLIGVWVFPYISRFENNVKNTLRFAVFMVLKYPGKTLLMSIELALIVLVCWLEPLLIPLFPGICTLIMSYTAEPVLKSVTSTAEDHNEDQWYNE